MFFISLLLLVLLAWLAGKLLWNFFYPNDVQLTQPQLNQSVAQESSINAISSMFLFGKPDISSAVKSVDTKQKEKLKESKLNLKLVGVLVAPNMSVAIIDKSGQSNSYLIDEEIQRNVYLKEVYRDYVLISNRGFIEKLKMEQTRGLFEEGSVSKSLSQSQLSKLTVVKENALKNPVSIMRYVRFQNISKNGKITGVKVWPRQEKEIFSALGFVAGDELISIDGQSIDKLAKSPTLWQSLLKQSQFELMVKRNGQEIPLSVGLE